nr:L,D-transpeptidase family protein [uncultured Ilyobacter sp.]
MFFIIYSAVYAGVKIDLVKVDKSSKKMFLMSGSEVIKVYDISLGRDPVGHKKKLGDKKTPEGIYILDYKNSQSIYYKSIHISYPNEKDKVAAAKKGWDPGGSITIHGQKKSSLSKEEWTEGCIGVTNREIDEIWELLDLPVTIIIEP